MIPLPIAFGLTICEKIILEEGSRNLTLINSFTKLLVEEFPTPPQRFVLHAALTDGLGDGRMDIVVTRLETDMEIYRRSAAVHFPSRTAEVRVIYLVSKCVFPAPGKYQVSLLLDDEWLTNRDLRVILKRT